MSRVAVLRALGLSMLLLLLGALVGLASVLVHEWWPMLVVSVLAVAALLLALPGRWWSRPPFAVGFAGIVSLAMLPRPEGDYLVGSDAAGYTLLALTALLVVLTAATLPRSPRRARSEGPRDAPVDSLR